MTESRLYNGRIIDAHCHVASTRFIPKGFVEGTARNIARRLAASGVQRGEQVLVDAIVQQHQDHQADGLIGDMDQAGIAQAVLLLPDFTFVMPGPLSIADMLDEHLAILARHPGRFGLLAGVDPRWGQAGIDLFERPLEAGLLHGLKLYPPCGYSPSDRSLYPYFELCRHHQVPVLTHVGPTSPALSFEFANPWCIDRAAQDFPEVNFILAHASMHFTAECVALAEYRPNVYLDFSAFAGAQPPGAWKTGLKSLFDKGINHKILFGTDWPLFGGASRHERLIRAFTSEAGPLSGVAAAQRGWIMAENAARLFAGLGAGNVSGQCI